MLLVRCFLPLWNTAGMTFLLYFYAKLAQAVPCRELYFAPDERLVEFVRCLK
jgi:hypothetical protein